MSQATVENSHASFIEMCFKGEEMSPLSSVSGLQVSQDSVKVSHAWSRPPAVTPENKEGSTETLSLSSYRRASAFTLR